MPDVLMSVAHNKGGNVASFVVFTKLAHFFAMEDWGKWSRSTFAGRGKPYILNARIILNQTHCANRVKIEQDRGETQIKRRIFSDEGNR